MKLIVLVIAILLFTIPAFAQTPFDFPANPTVGEKVTAPGGQQFEWDGVKWAAILLPSDFLSKNNPAYTGSLTGPTANFTGNVIVGNNLNVNGFSTHGTATIANLAITTNLQIASDQGANLLFSGFPMGGTCPAGEFVNALSAIGKLTCAAAAGGGASIPLVLPNTGESQIQWGTYQDPSAAILGFGPNNLNIGAGIWYNGAAWIATATSESLLSFNNGDINFFSDTGLTVGATSPPTLIASLNASGLNLVTGQMMVAGPSFTPLVFGNPARSSIYHYATGTAAQLFLIAGGQYAGGWRANITGSINELDIGQGGTGGGFNFVMNWAAVAGNAYTKTSVMLLDTNGLDLRLGSYRINGVPIALGLGARSSPPANPTPGETYYDSTLHKLRVFTTQWETITSSP